MAIYRSTVNAVMVRTVALAAISESTLPMMHMASVKGYISGYQRLYSSWGMPAGYLPHYAYAMVSLKNASSPETNSIKSETARLNK